MNQGCVLLAGGRNQDSEAMAQPRTVLETITTSANTNTMDASGSSFKYPTMRTMAVTPDNEQQKEQEPQGLAHQTQPKTNTRAFDFPEQGTRMILEDAGDPSSSSPSSSSSSSPSPSRRQDHDHNGSRSHAAVAASYDVVDVSINSSIDSEEQELEQDDNEPQAHSQNLLQVQMRLQLDRMTSYFQSPHPNDSSTSLISELDSHYHDHSHTTKSLTSIQNNVNANGNNNRSRSMSIGTTEKTYATLPSLPESDVFFMCDSHHSLPSTTSGISEIEDDNDDDDDYDSASFAFLSEDQERLALPRDVAVVPTKGSPPTTATNLNISPIDTTFTSNTPLAHSVPLSDSMNDNKDSQLSQNHKLPTLSFQADDGRHEDKPMAWNKNRDQDVVPMVSTPTSTSSLAVAAPEIEGAMPIPLPEASFPNVTTVTPEQLDLTPQRSRLPGSNNDDSFPCSSPENETSLLGMRDRDPSHLLFSCATCALQDETIRRQQEDIEYYRRVLQQALEYLQQQQQFVENENKKNDQVPVPAVMDGNSKQENQKPPPVPSQQMIDTLQMASKYHAPATASYPRLIQPHADKRQQQQQQQASTTMLHQDNNNPPSDTKDVEGGVWLVSKHVHIRNRVVQELGGASDQDYQKFWKGLPIPEPIHIPMPMPMRSDCEAPTSPNPSPKGSIKGLSSFDAEFVWQAGANPLGSLGDPDVEAVASRGLMEEQATAVRSSAAGVMEKNTAVVVRQDDPFPLEGDTRVLSGVSQVQSHAPGSDQDDSVSINSGYTAGDEGSHEQEGGASLSTLEDRQSPASLPASASKYLRGRRTRKRRLALLHAEMEKALVRLEERGTPKITPDRNITVPPRGILPSLRKEKVETAIRADGDAIASSKERMKTEFEIDGLPSKPSKWQAPLSGSGKQVQVKTLHVDQETWGTRVRELESQTTGVKSVADEKVELLQALPSPKTPAFEAQVALQIAIQHAESQRQTPNDEDTQHPKADKEELTAPSSELESALEEANQSQDSIDSLRAEKEIIGSHIEQKEAASTDTSKLLKEAHNKTAQLEDLLKETQAEVTAFGASIANKESKIEELEFSMTEKEKFGNSLETRLQILLIEKESLQSQLKVLEHEKDETKRQLQGAKADTEFAFRERTEALSRVYDYESTRGGSDALLPQLESRNEELRVHLVEYEEEIKAMTAEKEATSIHISELASEKADLEERSQETKYSLSVLEKYLNDTLDEIASLKFERETLYSQMADKEAAMTEVESRLEDTKGSQLSLEGVLNEREAKICSLNEEKNGLVSKLGTMESKKNQVEMRATADRSILEKQIGDLSIATADTSNELKRVEADALTLKTLNETLVKRSQRVENDKLASDALAEKIQSQHEKLESKLQKSNARTTALLVRIEGNDSPTEALEGSSRSVQALHSAPKESAANEDVLSRIEKAVASKILRVKTKADSKLQELARMKDEGQNKLHDTESKLAAGQNQLKLAEDKTRHLETVLAASKAQVGSAQEVSDQLKIRLVEVESQKLEVQSQLESMDGFVGFLEAEKFILFYSAKDMESEKERVKLLLQESESQTTALEIQLDEQKQSYDMLCAEKQEKEVRIEELIFQKGTIEAELRRTKEEIVSLKSENASVTMKVGDLEGTNEKLQADLDETRKEVGVSRGVIVMLQSQQQKLSFAKSETEASFKEVMEKNSEDGKRLRGAEQQIAFLRAEMSTQTIEAVALSREKKELEELVETGMRQTKALETQIADKEAFASMLKEKDAGLDEGEFAPSSSKPQTASLSPLRSPKEKTSRVRQMEIELELFYIDDQFYTQKAKYSGALYSGLPDGMGVLWFENGDLYVGEFHMGEMHGVGAFNHKRREQHREQVEIKNQIFKGGFVHNEFVGPLPPIRRVRVSKIPDSQ